MRKRIADTRGFTLIELLVVCVLIGALASMAIIQMNSSKDRAFVAAMENDLRNVAAAQEAHYEETLTQRRGPRYANRVNQLDVTLSQGVTVRMRGNRTGWWADTRHTSLPRSKRCAIYTGGIRRRAPATAPGIIACN